MDTGSGSASTAEQPRMPLSRARVLRTAVALADRDGIDALSMRRLAEALQVEAMSLYHHVRNKEAILDGVVEVVVGEILDAVTSAEALPADDWRDAMRATILTARQVMLRHRWAPRVAETRRGIGLAVIGYFNHLLGILVEGGFSYDLAHHAMHVLGSRALGFTQELFEPEDADAADTDMAVLLEQMGQRYPYIAGMLAEVAHAKDPEGQLGWCDDQFEFEFGLDVILDGLERLRAS